MASKVKIPKFMASDMKIQTEENKDQAEKDTWELTDQEAEELDSIASEFENPKGLKQFEPCEFEKDDDTNHHIDFIHAAAMLKARCYRIKEVDQLTTKFKAGNIIPALATTTAMIVGTVCSEMYKVVAGRRTIEDFRNYFVNLALGLFLASEPSPPTLTQEEYDPIYLSKIVPVPKPFSVWHKLKCEGPVSINGLIDHLKK